MQQYLVFQSSLFLDGLIGIYFCNPSNDFNLLPSQWTYIYDNTPLEKTLEKYIDFKKLSPDTKQNNNNNKNDNNNRQ